MTKTRISIAMLLALALNLTFLPALLTLLHPRGRPEAAGLPGAAAVDRFLLRRRSWVLGAMAVLAAMAAAVVTFADVLHRLAFGAEEAVDERGFSDPGRPDERDSDSLLEVRRQQRES